MHSQADTWLIQALEHQYRELDEADDNFDISEDALLARRVWRAELKTNKRRLEDQHRSRSPPAKRTKFVQCSICLEPGPEDDMYDVECCNTMYHAHCFEQWFVTMLDSRQLTKCCGEAFEPGSLRGMLTEDTRHAYTALKDEYDAEKRIYCHNAACATFLKIDDDDIVFVECGQCSGLTCASCGDEKDEHIGPNLTCSEYIEDEALNRVIKSQNWQRCPRCQAIVEKNGGCTSIQCQCGQRFCYQCGGRQKAETDSCRC